MLAVGLGSDENVRVPVTWWRCPHPPEHASHSIVQVSFIAGCSLLIFAAAAYIFTRKRPVYLLNYHCFKPNDRCIGLG